MEKSLFRYHKKSCVSFLSQKQRDLDKNMDKRNMLCHRGAPLCKKKRTPSKVD